jgi:hypothetical protein
MAFRTTSAHQIHSDRCCVLFHPKTGAIQHVHRVITYVGAEETPPDEMERAARGMRREPGGEMHSLIIESREFSERGRYKVDPKARRLVPMESKQKKPARPVSRPASKPKAKPKPKAKAGAKKRR